MCYAHEVLFHSTKPSESIVSQLSTPVSVPLAASVVKLVALAGGGVIVVLPEAAAARAHHQRKLADVWNTQNVMLYSMLLLFL